VDLDRKVAWLDHGTTKSGDGRGIPLNADAVVALDSTRGQQPRWCFTFVGQRIQQSSTAWDKAKRRAGIEEFRRAPWPDALNGRHRGSSREHRGART
jgi:hypothetical protein